MPETAPKPRRLVSPSEHHHEVIQQRADARAKIIVDVREFLRLRKNNDGGTSLTAAETAQLELMLHV
jgi:hypothetical protein